MKFMFEIGDHFVKFKNKNNKTVIVRYFLFSLCLKFVYSSGAADDYNLVVDNGISIE